VSDAVPADVTLPTLNPAYNGSSQNIFDGTSGALGVGDVIEVTFSVRLDPTAVDPLPESFENVATGSASAPDGSLAEDDSNDGSDPRDGSGGGSSPTVISLEDVAALPIVLGQFSSTRVSDSQVLVRWQTQTEVSNLGFNLYGQQEGDWQLLNPQVIAGQGDSVVVVDYEYLASSDARFIAISDIDARGEETLHGPYRVGQRYGSETQRQSTDWTEAIERRAEKEAQRTSERRAELLKRSQQRNNLRKVVGE